MTRLRCISNRNLRIVAACVTSRLGTCPALFEGLSYPRDEYLTADQFFLNENEWTTYENFERVFRYARNLVGDPDFYFDCGRSAARFRSWGRFQLFAGLFDTPEDAFLRLPFFNRNLDDTKEIRVVLPPVYDPRLRKMRLLIQVDFHPDFDPHRDYIGDPYLRGMLSSIPTIWGLPAALIKQPLNPYHPEILLNREPEFQAHGLEARIEEDFLTLRLPETGERAVVGQRVILEPEMLEQGPVFVGGYRPVSAVPPEDRDLPVTGFLITRNVRAGGRSLVSRGEIFQAPYFLLDILYERFARGRRWLRSLARVRREKDPDSDSMELINQLRQNVQAKDEAYRILAQANHELGTAKARLEDHSRRLEQMVAERTAALQAARETQMEMNRNLEQIVQRQVAELERHRELRRYLSPKIAELILSAPEPPGCGTQRRLLTVVFTDIRDFAGLTDRLEPEETTLLLDRYLATMVNCVHRHEGTLNKIMGDGLCIFFGDPVAVQDHAARAVRMAIEMQREILRLRAEWRLYGLEPGVGIGINSGYVTVGTFGPEEHRDYTVIGNQVNVAARLATLAKAGEILVSQRTYGPTRQLCAFEEMGDLEMKGIHAPVRTYRVCWHGTD